MVEAAQNRGGHDASAEICAAGPPRLAQDPLLDPLVRSSPVEVSDPLGEHPTQVAIAKDQDVIEALAAS